MMQKKTAGVTIVSLLVGISLSAFLIAVMLQVFAATRANMKLAENIAEMDDVLRYSTQVMTKIIGQAGYRTPNSSTGVRPIYSTSFPVYPSSDDIAGEAMSYYSDVDFVSNAVTDFDDKFWVKFQGATDGTIRDCNDLYGVAGTATRIRFYSREKLVSDGNSSRAYYCERQDYGDDYEYSENPNATVLIPAELFDSVWVRFGEDVAGKGFIDRWSLGADVQDRTKVYAVRVAILIHSREPVRSEDVMQSFEIFGNTITRTDKYLYKVNIFTVTVPNLTEQPFLKADGNLSQASKETFRISNIRTLTGGEQSTYGGGNQLGSFTFLNDDYEVCTATTCPEPSANGNVYEDILGLLYHDDEKIFVASSNTTQFPFGNAPGGGVGFRVCNNTSTDGGVSTNTGDEIIINYSDADSHWNISGIGDVITGCSGRYGYLNSARTSITLGANLASGTTFETQYGGEFDCPAQVCSVIVIDD